MSQLIANVAAIARHCYRDVHWKKTARGPRCIKEPLRGKHLDHHVNGGPAVGLAPIVPGTSTTQIAVLDMDDHERDMKDANDGEMTWPYMVEIALVVRAKLRSRGLEPNSFRSSGGRGIHLIMLWDEPQDAYSVRKVLEDALAACKLKSGVGGVWNARVECFPKQNEVAAGAYGSMVWMPFAGKSVPLDPTTLEPLDRDSEIELVASKSVPVVERPKIEPRTPPSAGSHAEVAALLAQIPNDGPADYEFYFKIISAIHDATGGDDEGKALANDWSARNDAHVDGFMEEKIWQYARSDRGRKYTIDTLRAEARKHENVVDHFPDLNAEIVAEIRAEAMAGDAQVAREKLAAAVKRAGKGAAALIRRVKKDTGIEIEVPADPAKAFRNESRAIGEGAVLERPPRLYDQMSMLAEAVYISEWAHIALREDPRCAWSFEGFDKLTAASKRYKSATGRHLSCASAWLRHPQRVEVYTRTFKAGAPLFCRSPNDFTAINTWREPPRVVPPDDWQRRAQRFLDHVAYLVPKVEERELFLDWLAHIELHPGVLPHVHFLMFTPTHGIGRNWLSSVLARVWAGVVALDVDLPAMLAGGFNGMLSRKVFAVVNEIHEGLNLNAYRVAQRLREFLTNELRHINPKFGHQETEFNAIRWLIYSNHEGALPLDKFDRRIIAVRNPDTPRSASYYTDLYALAVDPLFIASVREALRVRDIGKFNPGMVAPMTETKREVVDASMSAADLSMQEVVESYPSDCITSDVLSGVLYGGGDLAPKDRIELRYVMGRSGARKYRVRVRVHRGGKQKYVWVLRNHERWLSAGVDAVASEVRRGEELSIKQDMEANEDSDE